MSENKKIATIAERLKIAMDLRNIKQSEIVEKTGINKGALSSYLSARYSPKQTNIYLMAKALCVDEAWLLGYDVAMNKSSQAKSNTLSLSNDNEDQGHYLNDETAAIAQEIYANPDLKILFDVSKKATPEDLKTIAKMLASMVKDGKGEDDY